jgi:ferrous iron transport protein A
MSISGIQWETTGSGEPLGSCPLTGLPVGVSARVVDLEGGREFRERMYSLGLGIGRELRVLRAGNGTRGPISLAVGEVRLAIGRGMADKIRVARADVPGVTG